MVNPFGDFEGDFKKAEKAENSAGIRVPSATYKFVLTTQELRNKPGEMVDHDVFVTPKGTKAFKIFCEILEPESVVHPKTGVAEPTKGIVLEHPFWITKDNLPYVKRDAATILGRELENLGEMPSIIWAGRTFEGVVGDEEYMGRVSSKIKFINPWAPPAEPGANPHGAPAAGQSDKKDAAPKKDDQKKPAEQGAGKKGAVDF